MSVKSKSREGKDFLRSTTIMQSSLLLPVPVSGDTGQQNLSSMIKIGGKSIFELEKKQPSQITKRPKVSIQLRKSKATKEDLAALFSHLNHPEKPLERHLVPLDIHGRKRSYKIKLSLLKPVCRVLTMIFEGTDFRNIKFDLTELELRLISVFIAKKTRIESLEKFSPNLLNPAQKRDLLTRFSKVLYVLESTKREEENIKFAYKHTLKYLKGKYNQQHSLPFNKQSELKFYQYYFQAYTECYDKPLQAFFDPLNSKLKLPKKNKTLSTPHLSLIFSCYRFSEDFFEYFDRRFSTDYLSCVYKKMEKIFIPLEKQINERKQESVRQVVNRFIENFRSKQRIKFPWSYKETETSLKAFANKIKKIKQ